MAADQDPTKVVVNGAALNFMTTLVDGLRRDMALTEERLTRRIDRAFADHAEDHDIDRADELEWRKRTRDRLTGLEKAEIAEQLVEATAKGVLVGRWQAVHAASSFMRAHGWKVVSILGLLFGFVSAAVGGVSVHFGPPT